MSIETSASRILQIPEQVAFLEEQSNKLDAICQQLFQRLSGAGVMSSWPSVPNDKVPEKKSLVPIAQRLNDISTVVASATANIDRMIVNLEV